MADSPEQALIQDLVERIHAEFRIRADQKHREGLLRYFRDQDKVGVRAYGVRQAQMGPIVRLVYQEIKNWPLARRNKLMQALWESGTMEDGALVAHVYRRFSSQCAACEFQLFERWLDRYVHNWAHCDGVASWLVSASLINAPQKLERVQTWTKSRNRWKRRAAAVSLLKEAEAGRNISTILEIAEALKDDADDLVRKGLGWLLKVAYAKQPEAVVEFLEKNIATLPRVTLRYACEKMPRPVKQRLMKR